METETISRQIKITDLLPFMNRNFFELMFEKNKVRVVDIKIEYENFMPSIAILSFVNKSYKEDFVQQFSGKNYDKLSYKISLQENTQDNTNKNSLTNNPEFIKFPIAYNKLLETSYERTIKEPGLIFTDKSVIVKQDKVISFLIKKIGSNLIKGQSIMTISLPVNIFDKRTLLQVFAYEMSFAPIFLSRAYYSIDLLERVKWMTVFLLSQINLSPLMTKPFSPILGETFQCKIGDLNIYIEQTEHKPLTFNFYMFSSKGIYKIYGSQTCDAATGANTIKASKSGNYIVEFQDGATYQLYMPQVHIKGTTVGKRLFNYKHSAIVADKKNNLASFIQFNPDEKGGIVGFFSKQKTFPDTIRGNIIPFSDVKLNSKGKHTKSKDAKNLCKIEGEWTNYVSFDDYKYWSVKDHEVLPLAKLEYTLPSDSIFREDLNFFLKDDEENAQLMKEKMEERQRTDRKLREPYSKQNK